MNDALVKAQEALTLANEAKFIANNMWLLVATVLVFIMHLGFATLECKRKTWLIFYLRMG